MKSVIFLCMIGFTVAVTAGRAPPTACMQEKAVGPCLAAFRRFFYNSATGECEEFTYGGCQGNSNNFNSREECHAVCTGVSQQQASSELCNLESETGVCMAYFERYFFNKDSGKCEMFVYGGCGGNENNFETIEECHQACVHEAVPSPGDCLEEDKVVGPCEALMPRWSFNKMSGKCEEFNYGGCHGSKNNFRSEEDCRNLCVAGRAPPTACMQEKAVGPCMAVFRRFFYNSATGECEEFIYGGCQGNSNNFNSKEECHAVCAA